MSFSPLYIVTQAVAYLAAFFKHWYVDGFRWFASGAVSTLEELDQTFALRVTLRNLFQPLYQDYSIIGRILGLIFRPARLFIGGVIYLIIIIAFVGLFGIWALTPPYLLAKFFIGS